MNIEIYLQLRIKKSLRDSRQKIRKDSLFLRFISVFFYRVVAIKVIQIEISPMYDSSPIMFGVNISTGFCDANNAWKKNSFAISKFNYRFKNKFCWIIKIITKDVQSNWSLIFFATYSSSLTFQHNYFNYSRKLFSDMYLSKFLDTLAKLFFFSWVNVHLQWYRCFRDFTFT